MKLCQVTRQASSKSWRHYCTDRIEMMRKETPRNSAGCSSGLSVVSQGCGAGPRPSSRLSSITQVYASTKGFKAETAAEEKVAGKPVTVLKVSAPDGKDFTLSFDKESGLPVRLVAKVRGFQGEEFTQETTFSDFTDYDGIKRAKKVETKRDGETFVKSEVTEFKAIEKVDPKIFDKPE